VWAPVWGAREPPFWLGCPRTLWGPLLDKRPKCKPESATFGEAGWVAARPSIGQNGVSAPSPWAPLSCGRLPAAQKSHLVGNSPQKRLFVLPPDRWPRCKPVSATFGEAGWNAACPSAGQDGVSTTSAWAFALCGAPLAAQEGRLCGQPAPGHCLGWHWTAGPCANLNQPYSKRLAGNRPVLLLGRTACLRRWRGRPFRVSACRRPKRAASLGFRPQETVWTICRQVAPEHI